MTNHYYWHDNILLRLITIISLALFNFFAIIDRASPETSGQFGYRLVVRNIYKIIPHEKRIWYNIDYVFLNFQRLQISRNNNDDTNNNNDDNNNNINDNIHDNTTLIVIKSHTSNIVRS
uniref:Uncharacterized protein n=1 Tax=Octopus bimaculoides TaxID=37653 RepID=A0A0L8HW92_OCTBM